jgi:hypothetical protein
MQTYRRSYLNDETNTAESAKSMDNTSEMEMV